MGQYNTAIVTQQGQQILAEAVGAQQVITFTSVKTSSHSYSSETDLTTLTGLQDIMQSVSPSSAAVTNGNIVEVTARFDNTGVQNEYQIQTIGLYGKTPNGEETLIAVVKAVTPDTMPNSAYSPIAYIYSIQLTIQSGESVAVTVNPAGTATVQDVLELQQTIATLQQNVNEQIAQLNSDISAFKSTEMQLSEIDNISQNGFYKLINSPNLLIHIRWDTNYMAQLMFPYGNTQIARFRNKYAGTWGDWWDLKSLSNLFTVQPFFGSYVYNGVSTQEVTVPENRLTGNQWKIIATCQDAGAAIHRVSDVVPGSFKVDLESAVTSARINYCAFNLA